MEQWTLTDADDQLKQIVRKANCCGAQHIVLAGEGVIVLSETEYGRLAGDTSSTNDVNALECETASETRRPAESTRSTPRAAADQDREWVWEWDEETQRYALPWAKDVDPAEHPGLEFLNFMQNSPLAQAFRDGDFTPEEWDAACRMGR